MHLFSKVFVTTNASHLAFPVSHAILQSLTAFMFFSEVKRLISKKGGLSKRPSFLRRVQDFRAEIAGLFAAPDLSNVSSNRAS